jgi:transposase
MEERLRFVARLLENEPMTELCREFGISRKTGYKIYNRYKEQGVEAFTDRSRRPVRYANQLPDEIETRIVHLKRDKPHWGALKIRELLLRQLDGDVRVPAISTVHAVLDRHGLVKRRGANAAARRARRCPRPGSSENDGAGLDIVNVIHSDDLMPLLSEKSPLLAFLEREGVDLVVDRPEASLEGLPPLDTPEALFQATQNTAYKIEHQIPLYLDTAAALAENTRVTPGVAESARSLAWLDADVDRFVLGNDAGERYLFADGSQVLIGRGGNDALTVGPADDGLSGGLGNDRLDGGYGDDLMDGGTGRDWLSGGPGDDLVYASAGIDKVDGGPGEDTVVFPGSIDDYRGVREGTHRVASEGGNDGDVMVAQLRDIETLRFEDALFEV